MHTMRARKRDSGIWPDLSFGPRLTLCHALCPGSGEHC